MPRRCASTQSGECHTAVLEIFRPAPEALADIRADEIRWRGADAPLSAMEARLERSNRSASIRRA
jgi:hypothetical protein